MRPTGQQDGADEGIDPVEEASEESFPASDPHLDTADSRRATGVESDDRIVR